MKTRTIIITFGLLLFCCIVICCVGSAAYFYLAPNNNIFIPPTYIPPQANVETPTIFSPTETPVAACPNLMADIVQASQGSAYGPDSGGASSSNTDWHTLVTYQIDGNRISNPTYEKVPKGLKSLQQDTTSQQAAWNLFIDLIPSQDRKMLSEYQVFTDGPSNILAAVEQASDDPAKWIIEVDEADLQNKKELVFTLIHEYAHLLTLNADQVPPDIAVFNNPDDQNLYDKKVAACPTYFPDEGCSKPNSYINTFYNRFWVNIVDEWKKIDALSTASDQNPYYDKLYAFYLTHQDQFVDDYAATNASEDMAETFAFYVLSPRPTDNSMRDQKILFFYDYPELVQLRSQILENLCTLNP
ncbi:MAG: hypothetical protein M1282_13120 [Chloroflexi bacterium]|nr:hypothetical protein [Chloroflexota bacterium]